MPSGTDRFAMVGTLSTTGMLGATGVLSMVCMLSVVGMLRVYFSTMFSACNHNMYRSLNVSERLFRSIAFNYMLP